MSVEEASVHRIKSPQNLLEPRHERTCLRGFRQGPTQSGLYSHRRWQEACNLDLGSRGIVLCCANKGLEQLRG